MKKNQTVSMFYFVVLLFVSLGIRHIVSARVEQSDKRLFEKWQVRVYESDTLQNESEVELEQPPKKERKIYYAKSDPDNKKKQPKTRIKPVVLEINSASVKDWQRLYGIGEVLSERIVKFREKLGGFHSVEQLYDVYGLPAETIDALKPQLICHGEIVRVNIHTATFKELLHHPYLDYDNVKLIMKFRKNNQVENLKDAIQATGLTKEKARILFPYFLLEDEGEKPSSEVASK